MSFVGWNSLCTLRSVYDHPEPGYDDTPWKSLMTRGGYEMELEVCEFIYAVIRLMKPDLVIECGAGYGLGTSWIGYALQENQHGRVVAYESEAEFFEAAKEKVQHIDCAEVLHGTGDTWRGDNPQLLVLDSNDEYRRREIDHFKGRGIVAIIHDAHRYDNILPRGVKFQTYRGAWIGVL